MRDEKFTGARNVDRFAFSETGFYKAPYKSEALIIGIIMGVVIALAVLITLFMANIMKDNLRSDSSDFMVMGAMGVGWIAAMVVLFAVGGILAKMVRGGYKCKYIADSERFITDEGGHSRTIYYRDVLAVNFSPRTFFGKARGYDITVKLRNAVEVYALVSDGFISEKSTPFRIITEQVDRIRAEESKKEYERQLAQLGLEAMNGSPTAPKATAANGATAAGIGTLQTASVAPDDKADPSSRLGQDAAMPTVRLSPAADTAKKPTVDNEYYIDEFGRERFYSEAVGSGRFKVLCSKKKTTVLAILAAIGLLVAVGIYLDWLGDVLDTRTSSVFGDVDLLVSFIQGKFKYMLCGLLFTVIIIIIYCIGDECTYRANGREFVVTDKKGAETHIYYSEALGVNYFRAPLGYKVEILTRRGIISFHCVDKRKKILQKPELIPFDIIKKRIKK
ncbi:MAG: hypothetical protein ACI4JY_05985 [Oscillospiraceae bacterium]